MTGTATYIAGDWGTTHLRLFLCSASDVLDRRSGPGVGELQADPETTLSRLIEPWARSHGRLPIWLAGMIGSRNGWREAPYLPCPADVGSLGESTLRFTGQGHQIAIVPGVSCTNPRGAPDVMRGEETQILGALARDPALGRGRQVLALPGTHTKWVLVEDGRIVTFQTSLAGELYRLLRERSTLASIALVSGSTVPIVGAAGLANLYRKAFAMHGVGAQPLDAAELTLAGLRGIAQRQGG